MFVAVLMLMATGATFAANGTVNMNSTATVTLVSDEVDNLIAQYEKLVNKYIALAKKVKAGDMSGATEMAKLAQDATKLSEKLDAVKDEMSVEQATRLAKAIQKMAKAAQEMM